MLKTHLYLPEDLNEEIERLAEEENKSKAETLREVIRKGVEIKKDKIKKNKSLEPMYRIAELAKKYTVKGPKDLSENLDKYLWDDYEP